VRTKRPQGKRKRPARKKVLPFDQWEKISFNVGKKRPWEKKRLARKKVPAFQTHII
jgi:hypothetical protein